MLYGAGLIKRLVLIQIHNIRYIQLYNIKYHRKPRWLPIAPSKLFRIPVKPIIPQEDKDELFKLHTNYKTEMKTIRNFFAWEFQEEAMSAANATSLSAKKEEEILFQKAVLENEEWNRRVAIDRIERLKKESAERELQVLTKKEEKRLQKELELEKAAEKLRRLREDAKNFIPREMLDEAIERALNTKTDYNFAITVNGEVYVGSPREGNENVDSS